MTMESVSPAEMRSALGQFASGVTVVTGMDEQGPIGFACQSFASVSLDPPLVLFCADHRGRSWPRIRATGRFTVNVLNEDQADLCARFGSRAGRKFDDLECEISKWSTPSLPGVLMRLHGQVHQVHTAGDHDVVIGRVLELETVTQKPPMIFFRGRFGIGANSNLLTA